MPSYFVTTTDTKISTTRQWIRQQKSRRVLSSTVRERIRVTWPNLDEETRAKILEGALKPAQPPGPGRKQQQRAHICRVYS